MFNTDSQQALIAILPEHLIIDNILPRLPAKSLIKFKIVCKLWLSIISSIDFAKSHLKFSSLCPKFVVVTENDNLIDRPKLFLLPSDHNHNNNNNVSELVTLDLDSNWAFTSLNFVGSCNGLLCFYLQDYDVGDNFYVRNPETQKCRKIMCPNGEDYAVSYGFSYASSIDDYKIVADFYWMNGPRSFYFSLRSSEWEMINGIDFTATLTRCNTLFYAAKDLDSWQEDKCIVGFDVVDEKLKEIPFMNWLSRYTWADFVAIKDCVSLLCYGDHGADVWVLKQYGDWNSWEKMYSFNFEGMKFVRAPVVVSENRSQLEKFVRIAPL